MISLGIKKKKEGTQQQLEETHLIKYKHEK